MTKLLIHLFLRDPENENQSQLWEWYGKLVEWIGAATNLVLFFIKLLTGFVFHSIVIMADTLNNLMDSTSSLMALFGFHLFTESVDAGHLYGYIQIEYIVGTVVSFLIVMVGSQLVQTSIGKILDSRLMEFGTVLLIALIVSVLLKVWQGLFYRKISRTIDSTTLLTSSQDSRSGALPIGVVLIGLLISYFIGWQFDGWLGFGVTVFISVAGFRLMVETANPLLGLAPSKKMIDSVYRRILSYPGIIGLHGLNIHNYGPGRCFASVYCEMCAGRNIVENHEIIDWIERDFLTDNDVHLATYPDLAVTGDRRANRLKVYMEESLWAVPNEITMHDSQVMWKPEDSRVIFDIVVPYRFSWSDERLMEYLSEKIKSREPQYESIITMGHDDSPPPRER